MTVETGTAPAAAATPTGDAAPAAAATPTPVAAAAEVKVQTPAAAASGSLAELVGDDADTREWLTKNAERVKDVPSALKLAREQDKMIGEQAKKLGDAVRIPGKDATPEEIKAYREKMGIPADADGYEFAAPKELPEGLPYDGEKAKSFAAKAAEIGLTKAQAQAVHDWATANAVGDFNSALETSNNQKVETAKAETEKLVKLWGPLNGETFKAEAAFADKALMEVGGQEALEAFQKAGLIGDAQGQKIIQSAAIATMLAKFGKAVYAEDNVLRGDSGRLENPFADGDNFNLTRAMKMVRENRDLALSHIAAAGKKPGDFGLKA